MAGYKSIVQNVKRKETYNSLIIKENNVEMNTAINYQAIDLRYYGKLSIESNLPSDYLFKKTDKRLLILKVNTRDEILYDLFNYFGVCKIGQANIYDKDGNKTTLYINRDSLVMWENISSVVDIDNTEIKQHWDKLTTDYENMTFTGRNNYIMKKQYYTERDPDVGTVTNKFRYIRTKPNFVKEDTKTDVLGDLYTKGKMYFIKGQKQPYIGFYHIHIKNNKVMTGREYNEYSQTLVTYKQERI